MTAQSLPFQPLHGCAAGPCGPLTDQFQTAHTWLEKDARACTYLLFKVGDNVRDHLVVEILTAEVGVSVCALYLKHALLDFQEGDVKGTTAQVIHGHDLVALLVQTIGQRSSGGLVDDTQDVEARDLAGVLCSLTLGVVKVGWDRDDSIGHSLSEEAFGRLLHLSQDKGANLRGRVLFAAGLDPGVAVFVLDNLVGDGLHVFLHVSVLESGSLQGGRCGVVGEFRMRLEKRERLD